MARSARSAVFAPGRSPDEKLTLAELCAELKIQRSTFYDWRAKGRAPRCLKLPNGEIRVTRRDLDAWLETCLVR
jgi:predicted DNA-binding transcriptional regulator AlpA